MNNMSPIPVKWARSSLARALLLEVLKQCHSKLYSSLVSLTSAPPPLKKDTLTQTLVSATPSLFLLPTPSAFLPFPFPCPHKPVMWLSEIMRWEFYCSALWAWHQSVRGDSHRGLCAGSLVWGALCWVQWALTEAKRCSRRPAMHFKVGDQGSTCAWHPENDNASVSLRLLQDSSPPNTKACRQLPYFSSWRKRLFTRVIYIQEEGALSGFYTNTGGQRQCEGSRGRTAEETCWQHILWGVLFDCWSINW